MTLCRKIIVLLCSAALVIGMLSVVPTGDAARAPKLSVRKMTIKRGQSLTIKLKYGNKKAKVKWATTKRKVAFITKKNTKGNKAYVTVKGSKDGTADITATYKLGSKKSVLRCKLTVRDMTDVNNSSNTNHETFENISNSKGTMAPAAVCTTKPTPWKYDSSEDDTRPTIRPVSTPDIVINPTGVPHTTDKPSIKPTTTPIVTPAVEQTPEAEVTIAPTDIPAATPTVSPSANPTAGPTVAPVEETLDLGSSDCYDSVAGTINIQNKSYTTVALPASVNPGDVLLVSIKGMDSGTKGFRCYLSSSGDSCTYQSSIAKSTGDSAADASDTGRRNGIVKQSDGTFIWDINYEVKATSNYLCFKGITYDSKVENLVLSEVKVTIIQAPKTTVPIEDGMRWVTTWGTAEEKCDVTAEAMPQMELKGSTVRQIIKVTTSGKKIKFRLSNQYGASAVVVNSMHIAKQITADKSNIDNSTDTPVTVGGKEKFEIPAGRLIETDAIEFDVNALENIAVSMYFDEAPAKSITGHRGARATTYQMSGNNVSSSEFSNYKTTTSWFFLADAALAMPEDSRAVVCFGDSITDGYGTDATYLGKKPDSYTRWGDYFAKRLQNNSNTKNVAVINEGIGGNSIMASWPTDAGKDRFSRDVLIHDGVEYCIILFGVNDLDKLQNTNKYNELLPEYKKMVKLCHDNGIKVYGAPILPFGTSTYYSENSETVRTMINNWMRSADSQMDGIIDFESALADPANPQNILEKYTHSDGLHPYDGYEAMANAIDLSMFY